MKQTTSKSNLLKFLVVLIIIFSLPLIAIGKTIVQTAQSKSIVMTTKSSRSSLKPQSSLVPKAGNDWPMYLHDPERTAASDEALLSPANAEHLVKNWSFKTGAGIAASAAIVDGTVFIGSWDGYAYALDEMTGALKWKRFLGITTSKHCYPESLGITSSAAVQGGVVYVGGGDAYWYALDANTGSVLWKVYTGDNSQEGGHYNWSSPLLYNNYAYIGIASNCDHPLVPGKVMQVSLTTHEVVHTFNIVDSGQTGGGIWTSPSIDPKANSLFFSSGTESIPNQPLTQAVFVLNASNLTLKSAWKLPEREAIGDSDFDTSPILFSNAKGTPLVAAVNKNGYIYVFDRNNVGAGPLWKQQIDLAGMCPVCEESSVSSNTIGQGMLFVAAGNTTINGVNYRGSVAALDPNTGKFLWHHGETGPILGALVYSNGLVICASGTNVEVLNASTGERLYNYKTDKPIYSSPSLAHGQIFEGSLDGSIYAFGLSSTFSASSTSKKCPGVWSCQDIGNPVLNGSETSSRDTWNITAGGTGSGNTVDQLHFVSQNVEGDGQIRTQILSETFTGIGGPAQVGLMVRQDDDSSSPNYAVFLIAHKGIAVKYRLGFGGETQTLIQMAKASLPLFLEIQRRGDQFEAATSSDGVNYTLLPGSTITVVLPTTTHWGMATSSANADTLTTVVYKNISLSLPNASPKVLRSSDPCPMSWRCDNVGNPARVGGQEFKNGTWTIQGGGTDIWWDRSDQFRYVYQPMTGDGSMSVHLLSLTSTTSHIKSGIMIRQGIDADAPYYGVFVVPDRTPNILIVEGRSTQGLLNRQAVVTNGAAPLYLRVIRSGNTFSTDTSTDGTSWTPLQGSQVTIDMGKSVLIGMAVMSKDDLSINTTVFSEVEKR